MQEANVQLVWDTILRKPTTGIPIWLINVMEWSMIDRLVGMPAGTYERNPDATYLAMQQSFGSCFIDQWIPQNPLSLGAAGYDSDSRSKGGATTGAERIVMDGMEIAEPEDVVAHMERFVWPGLETQMREFDEDACVRGILEGEARIQGVLGPDILKTGYGFIRFPGFRYGGYGYANYFMAYALYPEVMEKDFRLQADLALLRNRAAARAYREGKLPPLYRLDSDMADSRGMLVNIKTLDELWLPHFARCLEPVLKAGVNLIWHSDGNLMDLYPRLLEVGIAGFQGFQYEDGMDYPTICAMRTRDGQEPLIVAGSSVTRTLPMGTPADVRNELRFLVENGPKRGLFLGCSSSVAPGVPWENLKALREGLLYYRQGR